MGEGKTWDKLGEGHKREKRGRASLSVTTTDVTPPHSDPPLYSPSLSQFITIKMILKLLWYYQGLTSVKVHKAIHQYPLCIRNLDP
ncbi:hypothetical protein E2C01_033310 [Portunus trituberculatus]|uniref:Uncharacterized protein n=1 Tax=Portunus trituberculatus TaxID=210409 RepID=A0A5B7EYD4_PORTR|nr:hypothetical protein [Portunus trituberculatus]